MEPQGELQRGDFETILTAFPASGDNDTSTVVRLRLAPGQEWSTEERLPEGEWVLVLETCEGCAERGHHPRAGPTPNSLQRLRCLLQPLFLLEPNLTVIGCGALTALSCSTTFTFRVGVGFDSASDRPLLQRCDWR